MPELCLDGDRGTAYYYEYEKEFSYTFHRGGLACRCSVLLSKKGNNFVVIKFGEILDDVMTQLSHYVGSICGGDADGVDARSHAGLQSVDGIFEDNTLVDVQPEDFGAQEIAVGGGLGGSEVLAGQYAVEERIEVGQLCSHRLHLHLVRTGDDGTLHAMSLAVHHKILGSGYPIVAHLHFPFVQTFGVAPGSYP